MIPRGKTAAGSTPDGARNEQEASRWVQSMFGRVAKRYDFVNHLLSANMDRRWRDYTVRKLSGKLRCPGIRVLDLACGTGDLSFALHKVAGSPCLIASDFCHPMLQAAQDKLARTKFASRLVEADALLLPFSDSSVDVVTIGFGFRNFANYAKGLVELHRILRPHGTLAILEFTTPPNRFIADLYHLYSRHILPRIGGIVSGEREAYRYLPRSVQRFPEAPGFADMMRAAGFENVTWDYLTFGIVALHIALKPGEFPPGS